MFHTPAHKNTSHPGAQIVSLSDLIERGAIRHSPQPKHIEPGDIALGAARRMEDGLGGGFACLIGSAYFKADASNKRKLVDAFQELFQRFAREA